MNAHVNLPATLPNIDELVAGYEKSLRLYEEAFTKIAEADAAIKSAAAALEAVTPGASYHTHNDAREVGEFYKAVELPDRGVYLRTAQKLATLRGWHYVIDRCGMRQLMDAQAKKEFDDQLRYVPERSKHDRELITEDEADKGPPAFTAENIRATIERFSGDAEMIWRRGIANVFSQLDRRFRSHDGFKVGSRLIISHFAGYDGRVDTYGRHADLYRDIERAFHILEGTDPRHARSDFLHVVAKERSAMGLSWKCGQSEHDHEFFKVRIFKNGNAHLWFTRDDLVEKVNKELAAYYGEVLGDEKTREDDPLEGRAVTHARLFGFYPTPTDLADRIARQVPWRKSLRILEPSAGTGNLAFRLARAHEDDGETIRHVVDAIEIQPQLAAALRSSSLLNNAKCADFLMVEPTPVYDGVVMNPPFDRERDIDHVTHALKFLKPDGWLLAIMSAGVEFRETRKSAAFRKLLEERGGWMADLPAGSFASVGTHVNTVLVGIGMRRPYW